MNTRIAQIVEREAILEYMKAHSADTSISASLDWRATAPYANNRVEVSHQPTRHRERQMRGFKSIAHLQRFASVHGVVQNLFRVGRHLLRAAHHRALRTRAFVEWNVVTCAS